MITINEALSMLKKEVACTPNLYEEYKDRYRFVFIPDNIGSDPFSMSINVDIYKKTGKIKCPNLIDIIGEKMKPIRKGIFVQ